MLYFIWILFLPLVFSQGNFCPDGWKEGPHLCWRLTDKPVRFREAVLDCLTVDPARYGPVVNLIRVGQLRKLNDVEHRRLEKARKIRVDAIKGQDGIWLEYTSRRAVSFDDFPTFDPTSGLAGQTLIFNLKTKTLQVTYDTEDDYHGLCYRKKWGVGFSQSCYNTADERECSDNGDCVNGICVCDAGFSGVNCEIAGVRAARYVEADNKKPLTDCKEVKRDDGSTACYKVASEGSTYHEALEACISQGFTLAEIQGPLDQANLMAMAQPFKSAWIGLTDMDGDHEYSWASGASLTYKNWAVEDQLTDRMVHPCVALDPINEHKWIDVACEAKSDFLGICRVY